MNTSRVRVNAVLALLVIQTALASAWQSAGTAYTPKTGSPERKAIMDALRGPVERDLHKQVIFKVDHLKVQGDWAFMRGVPRQAAGGPIDYKGTRYEEAKREGVFDDWICALLKRKGSKWVVVSFVIGATDVVYEGWDREHGAPSSIFN